MMTPGDLETFDGLWVAACAAIRGDCVRRRRLFEQPDDQRADAGSSDTQQYEQYQKLPQQRTLRGCVSGFRGRRPVRVTGSHSH